MSPQWNPSLRPLLLLLPLGGLYLLSLSRMVILQAFPKEVKAKQALQRVTDEKILSVPCGRIMDRKGRVLAGNRQRWRLIMDQPAKHRSYLKKVRTPQQVEADLRPLASLAGLSLSELRSHVFASATYSVIQRGLSPGAAHRLQGALRFVPGTGLRLESYWERVYPQGRALAQLVGFRSETREGRNVAIGLEEMCQLRLQGQQGRKTSLLVGRSHGINPGLDFELPVPGEDVRTTLDADLAVLIRQRLQQAMAEHQPEWVTAVVIDARDGDLLAALALPDYDPNPGRELQTNQDGNPIGLALPAFWPVEPGSTFKPFILAGALEQNAVRHGDRFHNHGGVWNIRRPAITDVAGVPTRPLELEEILIHSSNICMGQVALEMEAEGLKQVLSQFAFWEPLGFAPWDERSSREGGYRQPGTRPDERRWKQTRWTLPSLAMGYQLSLTPVRLAYAYAALVRGGQMPQPRLFPEQSPVRQQVLQPDIADFIKEALAGVVELPVRRWLPRDQQLRWGGKSGTVRILDRQGQLLGRRSLFAAFGPVEDPEVVVVVVVEKPTSGAYLGSRVAGPIAGDVLRGALVLQGVLPPEASGDPLLASMHPGGR
ncbi:MAG: hypothetical protein DWQ01_13780 [Planctomycetota bacterium]|nr:MAG: hypothetical protein DWQ01_13780 [Planctomycetota bacterium]